jgi:DNA invertase Pin-like site-specific DNA recombinase
MWDALLLNTVASRKRRVVGDPKTAIGYLRVSTEEQHLGPEAQRAAIGSWAEREGVRLAAWYEDQGVSGGSELNARPGLSAALVGLREHNAGVLVVAKRDRLARDVAIARAITGFVEKAGASVRSADGTSDAVGPEGMMMKTMIDAFAEYERALIGQRTKAALAAKKARGEAIGPPPYGYKIGPNGVLVPEDEEQAVVAMIVGLARDDATEKEIVEAVEKRGFRSRAGKPLGQSQVHRILDRVPDWRMSPTRRFIRRQVIPCEDAEIDVDLYDVIVPFGDGVARDTSIEPLFDWIESGEVALKVVSLKHRMPERWRDRLRQLRPECSGKEQHQKLCAMAYLYLEGKGKKPFAVTGTSGRGSYGGGIADVVAADGSLYVECGSIGERKVLEAMLAGDRVMVIPYGLGGFMSPRAKAVLIDLKEVEALVKEAEAEPPSPFDSLVPDPPEERIELAHFTVEHDIILGFIFQPMGKVSMPQSEIDQKAKTRAAVRSLYVWGKRPEEKKL